MVAARQTNIPTCIAHVQSLSGNLALIDEDYGRAEVLFQDMLPVGSTYIFQIVDAMNGLVATAIGREDFALAQQRLRRVLPTLPNNRKGSALVLKAVLLINQGNFERAAELLPQGFRLQITVEERIRTFLQHARETLNSVLGKDSFAAAWERGKTLDVDEEF